MELLSRLAPLPLCLGVALALQLGCTRDAAQAPTILVDGSPARPPPVTLAGVGGSHIATRVRVASAGSLCAPARVAAGGSVLERTGVTGASVTFFDTGRRGVHACDATELDRSRVERWCAHAFGRLVAGRLRDPRLSITCRNGNDEPVGFAWIQPHPATAYLTVRQDGYTEVYAVSGTAPVRVSTSAVDLSTSRANFAISEHARNGTLLRSYDLEARVSG